MIKVSVLYPNQKGATFDMGYYCSSHIPMIENLLGPALKGISIDQGIAGAASGSPPVYVAIGHLLFDSLDAFLLAFGPHATAVMADVPRYTNVHPVIQISEVKR